MKNCIGLVFMLSLLTAQRITGPGTFVLPKAESSEGNSSISSGSEVTAPSLVINNSDNEYFFKKLNQSRANVRRNTFFTIGSAACLATGFGLGFYFNFLGDKNLSLYKSEYRTEQATALGDQFQNNFTTAEVFFNLAEGGILLTAIFGSWLALDLIKYSKWKKVAKARAMAVVLPENNSIKTAVNITYSY